MKIHWGWLVGGVVVGGGLAYFYDQKVRVPNAFALGQTYPTQAYSTLTAQQKHLLMQQPPLQSPPAPASVAGAAIASMAPAPSAIAQAVTTPAAQGSAVGNAIGATQQAAPASGYSAGSFRRSIFGTVLVD